MKPLTKLILVAVFSGVSGLVALAGPGPQYWQKLPTSAPTKSIAKPANDGSVLSCEHMLVRNTGPGADRVPFVSVACSPEMLRTNEQCWSECGVAAPAKAEPAGLTCKHMLIRNTGPGSSRVPLKSVTCTREMMKTNPECQATCRS